MPSKKSKRRVKADAYHAAWLKERGLDKATLRRKLLESGNGIEFPQYPYTKVQYSNVVGSGTKRGIMANMHKENAEVQKEILDKASRTFPLYNKGGLQYCTPETDIKLVGSKSRRG